MRSVIRWMRLVAPPPWLWGGAIAFSALCTALYLFCGWRFGSWDMVRQFLAPRDVAVGFTGAAIGIWRVLSKHPAFDEKYCGWLALTPWNRTQPPPLGPISLVPQDAIVVGLLMLLLTFPPLVPVVLVPAAFMSAYLATLAIALLCTNQRFTAFAIVFGLGLAVRCGWWEPWTAVACLAGTYLVAWRGLWSSLAEFPWRNAAGQTPNAKRLLHAGSGIDWPKNSVVTEMPLLWPFNLLHYKRSERAIATSDAMAAALLLGWWAYALFAPFIDREPVGIRRCYHLVGALVLTWNSGFEPASGRFTSITRTKRESINTLEPVSSERLAPFVSCQQGLP